MKALLLLIALVFVSQAYSGVTPSGCYLRAYSATEVGFICGADYRVPLKQDAESISAKVDRMISNGYHFLSVPCESQATSEGLKISYQGAILAECDAQNIGTCIDFENHMIDSHVCYGL